MTSTLISVFVVLVIVNLLLGVFIYSMTLYTYGDKFLSNKNLVDGVWCVDKLSSELGFLTGDKIIGVDGKPVERFSSIVKKMLVAEVVNVERNGKTIDIKLPADFIDKLINNEKLTDEEMKQINEIQKELKILHF